MRVAAMGVCLVAVLGCGGGGAPGTAPGTAGAGSGVAGAMGAAGAGAAGVSGAAGAPGAAGDSGAAGSGSAGVPGTAGAGGALVVTWSYPALIADQKRGAVFPTYMAHLLGKKIQSPFPTDLVCVDVTNPGGEVAASLVVTVQVYGTDTTQNLTLRQGNNHACATPIFDLTKLYALNDAAPGRIEAKLVVDGATVGAAMKTISISSVNDIAWVDGTIPRVDMQDLAAVFVTPKDPKVDQLQRVAAEASAFGGFGGGDPYQRDPLLRALDLASGEYGDELFVVEQNEPVSWVVPAISGANAKVGVYIFTEAQLTAWAAGTSTMAAKAWNDQVAGAKGTVTLPTGVYHFVVYNGDPTLARSISWSRNVTREEIAYDVLGSIYTALQTLKTKYSSITDSYFKDFQHVRRAPEVLSALSANCIDGALLFASTLELLGMEPVLVLVTGHAYVGVRSRPASAVVWSVETTMVGTSPYDDAFSKGVDEYLADGKADAQFHLVDVKAMRAKGVLPLPQ